MEKIELTGRELALLFLERTVKKQGHEITCKDSTLAICAEITEITEKTHGYTEFDPKNP